MQQCTCYVGYGGVKLTEARSSEDNSPSDAPSSPKGFDTAGNDPNECRLRRLTALSSPPRASTSLASLPCRTRRLRPDITRRGPDSPNSSPKSLSSVCFLSDDGSTRSPKELDLRMTAPTVPLHQLETHARARSTRTNCWCNQPCALNYRVLYLSTRSHAAEELWRGSRVAIYIRD